MDESSSSVTLSYHSQLSPFSIRLAIGGSDHAADAVLLVWSQPHLASGRDFIKFIWLDLWLENGERRRELTKEVDVMEENAKLVEHPKIDLEMLYIDEYLHEKGYSIKELNALPELEATRLMIEASQYASLKLAELESRARLRTKIHEASDFA